MANGLRQVWRTRALSRPVTMPQAFPSICMRTSAGLQLVGRDQWAEPQLNFTREFITQLCATTGLQPTGPFGLPTGIAPEDVLHYIYALLQAPTYRTYWASDLVAGFPPVPFPTSDRLFWKLSRLGTGLVALHLLESPVLENLITTYIGPRNPRSWPRRLVGGHRLAQRQQDHCPARGSPRDPRSGTIGFQGVPEEVWDFHIGGYQVCHKWLKDRKGRALSDEDIADYQKNRRRPKRDHPPHGRDRRGHRSPRRLARRVPDRGGCAIGGHGECRPVPAAQGRAQARGLLRHLRTARPA